MKQKVLIGILVTVLVLSLASVAVLAKGSYSYDSSSEGDVSAQALECNELGTLQERLECRFEHGSAAEVPEACDGLAVQDECIAFYQDAADCYDMTDGLEKDACFAEHSGYASSQTEDTLRWYVTALLYELQEYVEDELDAGDIEAGEASVLIADIIEMKRMALGGEDLSLVAESMEAYRNERAI